MMEKRARMLHLAANECVEHAKGSFERGSWNMAIRRAQEAVEIELTGVLALLGVHYPKDHDQAPLLFRVLKARNIEIDGSGQVERVSADLSRKRGPALQQEEGYDRETAAEAISDMEYVFRKADEVRSKL